ncbi:DoxX family membrane protein [Hymenobacter wooponensis]|uniref:DoxX family membrane protein n=1 Tax=Hymenobacter wooponensis TaxID=1525360 RepID=UPI001FDA0BAE|nr:DoxX family membrane protein [Hymenobacter wooponensis]
MLPAAAVVIALYLGGWWRRLYVVAARLLLGALMLGGGLYKLSDNHLPGLMGPPMNHAFLTEHGLVLFAQFIGVAQLVIGALLLTGRFALLGAVLLVPMWLNIIFLTWSLGWQGTPSLTGGFLILTIGLLLHDFDRLKFLLYPPRRPEDLHTLPWLTAGSALEGTWWLGLGILLTGSLLYPISLAAMLRVMGIGATVLLGATLWSWRQQRN